MKTLAQSLLNEQLTLNSIPAVKLQIQAYDFPAESSGIKFSEYDWTSVLETSKGGAWACCASDGSFVITSGTGATTVRITSPDLDTDFTSWGAVGEKGTFDPALTFCIAANPTSNEVIIAYLSGGKLYRQESTDYGASFGSATDMGASSGTMVRMAYTPTGDLAIVVGYTSRAPYHAIINRQYHSYNIYRLELRTKVRRSGAWTSPWYRADFDWKDKFTLHRWVPAWGTAYPYYETIYLENMDVAYDGDWFITYAARQSYMSTLIRASYSIILGNGTHVSPNSWLAGGEIIIADLKVNITSMAQLSHFSPRLLIGEEKAKAIAAFAPILLTQPGLLRMLNVHPAAFLHKISGYPLILSLYSDGRVSLCELKRGTAITTATFGKAYTFINDRPVKLCTNSSWIFAYNGDQIFMSPLPTDWSVPTIGTGAGSYIEFGE